MPSPVGTAVGRGSGVPLALGVGVTVAVGAGAGAMVMTVTGVGPPDVHAVVASPAASTARAAVRVVVFMWCSSREPPGVGGEGSTVVLRLHENFTVELPRP
jgi:hypothetical protein